MLAAWYTMTYIMLEKVAHRHGYALALHGSMMRDLDLIAIPWTDDANTEAELLVAFAKVLKLKGWSDTATEKPHGRRAFVFYLSGDAYIDLSVMPRKRHA